MPVVVFFVEENIFKSVRDTGKILYIGISGSICYLAVRQDFFMAWVRVMRMFSEEGENQLPSAKETIQEVRNGKISTAKCNL